jgi:chromosome segregation ATPase
MDTKDTFFVTARVQKNNNKIKQKTDRESDSESGSTVESESDEEKCARCQQLLNKITMSEKLSNADSQLQNELKRQVQSLQSIRDMQKQTIVELQQEERVLAEEKRQLAEANFQLTTEVNILKEQTSVDRTANDKKEIAILRESFLKEIENLRANLEEKTKEIASNEKLQQTVQEKNQQISELQHFKEAWEAEKSVLELQLEKYKQDFRSQQQNFNDNLLQLSNELITLENKIKEKNIKINQNNGEIATLEVKLKETQDRLRAQEAEITNSNKKQDANVQKMTDLETLLNSKTKEISDLKQLQTDLEQQKDLLQVQLERANTRANVHLQKYTELNGEKNDLEQEINTLETQLQREKEKEHTSKQQKEDSKKKLNDALQKNNLQKLELDNFAARETENAKKLESLQRDLQLTRDQVEDLEAQVKSKTDGNAPDIEQLQYKFRVSEGNVAKLQKENARLQTEKEKLEKEKAEALDAAEVTVTRCADTETELHKKTADLQRMTMKCNEAEAQVTKMREKIAELKHIQNIQNQSGAPRTGSKPAKPPAGQSTGKKGSPGSDNSVASGGYHPSGDAASSASSSDSDPPAQPAKLSSSGSSSNQSFDPDADSGSGDNLVPSPVADGQPADSYPWSSDVEESAEDRAKRVKAKASNDEISSAESESRAEGNEGNSEFRQDHDFRPIHPPGGNNSD